MKIKIVLTIILFIIVSCSNKINSNTAIDAINAEDYESAIEILNTPFSASIPKD